MIENLIDYANTDPDLIPDTGMVDLRRVKERLETLGFEPIAGLTGVPEVYVEVTTPRTTPAVDSTTSLWAPTTRNSWIVHVRSLTLVTDGNRIDLAGMGVATYRDIAAIFGLLAMYGEVTTEQWAALRLDEDRWRLPEWSWDGWISEADETADGRLGVDYLTIRDPGGEEVAVIIDRRDVSPTTREERRARKEAQAMAIVDAMNGVARG